MTDQPGPHPQTAAADQEPPGCTVPLFARVDGADIPLGMIVTDLTRDRFDAKLLGQALGRASDQLLADAEQAEQREQRRRERHQRLIERLTSGTAQAPSEASPTAADETIQVDAGESERPRLEVLELPHDGDGPPPFALVLSGTGRILAAPTPGGLSEFGRQCGAKAVLATPFPIEVW